MKKPFRILSILAAITTVLAFLPGMVHAEETNKPAIKEPKESTSRPIPFHGTISAVDKKQFTMTVGERTFQITSETRISKYKKPAILDDAVVGDNVGGAYKKAADGKLTATTINLGFKAEKSEHAPKPVKPEKPPVHEM